MTSLKSDEQRRDALRLRTALRYVRDARRHVRFIAKHCPEVDEMMETIDSPLEAADTVLAGTWHVNVDTEREEAHNLLDSLPAAAVSTLLMMLARICPQCGSMAAIRTSKPSTTPGCRLAYFHCPACGHVWKARLLCGHNEQ